MRLERLRGRNHIARFALGQAGIDKASLKPRFVLVVDADRVDATTQEGGGIAVCLAHAGNRRLELRGLIGLGFRRLRHRGCSFLHCRLFGGLSGSLSDRAVLSILRCRPLHPLRARPIRLDHLQFLRLLIDPDVGRDSKEGRAAVAHRHDDLTHRAIG